MFSTRAHFRPGSVRFVALETVVSQGTINHRFVSFSSPSPLSPFPSLSRSLFSENQRWLPRGNRHLSARYSASPSTRPTLSPEYSNCERQSRENTPRKFPTASLRRHIARYFNVPPTPSSLLPTRRVLPLGNTYAVRPPPAPESSSLGINSESKIKYLRELVNTVAVGTQTEDGWVNGCTVFNGARLFEFA